jgi:hypothetical protein
MGMWTKLDWPQNNSFYSAILVQNDAGRRKTTRFSVEGRCLLKRRLPAFTQGARGPSLQATTARAQIIIPRRMQSNTRTVGANNEPQSFC